MNSYVANVMQQACGLSWPDVNHTLEKKTTTTTTTGAQQKELNL